MSWIKLREDLEDDPAVAFIVKRCSVTGPYANAIVVAKLARVWSWAGRLSVDGRVPLATPDLVDSIASIPGLALAMAAAGWLEIGETYLLFPKWDRHNSEGAKARSLTAERVRKHRNTQERDEPVTHDRYQRRGEEKREESTSPNGDVGGKPPGKTPLIPGLEIRPPKGKAEPTQQQVDGFVARGVWNRAWLARHGTAYTGFRGRAGPRCAAIRNVFVRLGRDEARLEEVCERFLAAPPYKCRENPDPFGLQEHLDAVLAGLNGRAVPATPKLSTRERIEQGQEELARTL